MDKSLPENGLKAVILIPYSIPDQRNCFVPRPRPPAGGGGGSPAAAIPDRVGDVAGKAGRIVAGCF